MTPHDGDAPPPSAPVDTPPDPASVDAAGAHAPVDAAGAHAPVDAVSHFTVTRPVAVFVVFVAAVVFGTFSYFQLAVTLMPELSYPTLTVRTEYAGAAPEEVEQDLSRPIEESLGVISGLRRISSISRAGVSDVVLEFSWDTDMSEAIQDTLEKLDLVLLPEDAGNSLLLRFDPSLDPVMELSMASARDGVSAGASEAELRRLRRIGELQVKRALEPIKGVASVRVRGGLEEEIHVLLDSGKLSRLGIPIATVIDRLAEENINVAGGTVKEGRTDYMVRTVNEYEDTAGIADTVVAMIDGRAVRISDLGQVARTHKEREMVTRTAGRESVQIDIFKEADANMVELAARVREALGELPPEALSQLDPDAATSADTGAAAAKTDAQPGPSGGPGAQGGPGPLRTQEALAVQLYEAEDVLLTVVADRSVFIQSSIDEVLDTAILGGVLAVVVLFLFLAKARPTLIIAVSIPVSVMMTFAPLKLLDVSLNIMSLGGLALGIGMLVDSSIVVLESIYRCREEGDDLVTATVRGTRDVRSAVVASILTTIGVFLPMVFVEGVAGQAFGDLGMAVVFSLLASLVVALFLIPMLASRGAVATNLPRARLDHLLRLEAWRVVRADVARWSWRRVLVLLPYLALRLILAGVLELVAKLALALILVPVWLFRRLLWPALRLVVHGLVWAPLKLAGGVLALSQAVYPRLLRWSLAHTPAVLLLVAASVVAMVMSARQLDSELLPEVYQGEFTMEVALPVGTPLEETEAVLGPVVEAILTEAEGIESLIVTIGYDPANTQRTDEGEHTARFKLLLEDSADNAAAEEAVAARIRARLAEVPDLEARLTRPVLFSFRTPIEVEVYGDDLVRLRELAERVEHEMAAIPQLTDVESTLERGAPEVQIVYDRDRLRRYGLSVSDVANRVRDEVKGRTATRLDQKDRRVPIVVRLREDDRASVEAVKELIVDPAGTRAIRLDAVADVDLGEGPSEVRRVDGNRVALIRANLAQGASLGAAVERIEQRLRARIDWPSDMAFRTTGQSEEWNRSRDSLLLALGLSVFLVYVIMAAQFESLLYPFIIMFTIPLAFFGTFLTLWGLGVNLSIVVFLGMIMLAGIVVNNAIVLVDYIGQLKRRGLPLVEAVIEGGSVRLRPILMTTLTTALGLVPMALGLGDGAELRTPLAITVISGLVASTALTLLVIPTIYALVDRAAARLSSRARSGPVTGEMPERIAARISASRAHADVDAARASGDGRAFGTLGAGGDDDADEHEELP
ncbi:efflux RND transporter permease subunit [Haliangium sp.]|uniref:efflux RND transporter permease subunit n=1 Tax=Haliangium sp. TaxID=2663208 RepID=UPI003D124859